MTRTAWEKQLLVREKSRPTIHDYLPRIFEEFFELHGDRSYGDDGAILGGVGRLNGVPVTILAEVKGRNLEENKKPTLPCRIQKDTERHAACKTGGKVSPTGDLLY